MGRAVESDKGEQFTPELLWLLLAVPLDAQTATRGGGIAPGAWGDPAPGVHSVHSSAESRGRYFALGLSERLNLRKALRICAFVAKRGDCEITLVDFCLVDVSDCGVWR